MTGTVHRPMELTEIASDGGIFAFTAPFHGSMGGQPLNAPIVGMAPTSSQGYWEVGSDGGIFAFTAPFYGSMGGQPLAKPISGMTVDQASGGYWLVGQDGGIFAFNAPFYGSAVVTRPARPTGTGVYGGYGTEATAATALTDGWRIVGDAGALGTPSAPYTAELTSHPDLNVIQSIESTGVTPTWLSFWTVSWPSPGATFYTAGYQGGRTAASTLDGYSTTVRPTYVVLDPEGYNTPATTSAEWATFLNGWATGIRSVNPTLQPAFYANQSQFESFGLTMIGIPGFVAVSPITGNSPAVRGGNVHGYIAYPLSVRLR